jgi:hypothetical protein
MRRFSEAERAEIWDPIERGESLPGDRSSSRSNPRLNPDVPGGQRRPSSSTTRELRPASHAG